MQADSIMHAHNEEETFNNAHLNLQTAPCKFSRHFLSGHLKFEQMSSETSKKWDKIQNLSKYPVK